MSVVCMECRCHDAPGVPGECHVVQGEQVHGGAPPVHRPRHSGRLKKLKYVIFLHSQLNQVCLVECEKRFVFAQMSLQILLGKQTIFIWLLSIYLLQLYCFFF